jgi:hypothetical protein
MGLGIEWITARSSAAEELLVRLGRHRADRAARHQKAEGMDGVARIGHEDHVARRRDGLRHVGEAFLRAERGDDLRVGIELHAETPGVIAGLGTAQPRDALGGRIAIRPGLAGGLDQFLDDMLGRRQVRDCPCPDR